MIETAVFAMVCQIASEGDCMGSGSHVWMIRTVNPIVRQIARIYFIRVVALLVGTRCVILLLNLASIYEIHSCSRTWNPRYELLLKKSERAYTQAQHPERCGLPG